MVPNTDLNVMSVINYAVTHLKVKHVVVCGHYSCGGVKAAMQSADLGILNPWLRNIRDVYRTHQSTLDNILDENERYNKLIELNVQEQCINVILAMRTVWMPCHLAFPPRRQTAVKLNQKTFRLGVQTCSLFGDVHIFALAGNGTQLFGFAFDFGQRFFEFKILCHAWALGLLFPVIWPGRAQFAMLSQHNRVQ